jgi:hypothetical protein
VFELCISRIYLITSFTTIYECPRDTYLWAIAKVSRPTSSFHGLGMLT